MTRPSPPRSGPRPRIKESDLDEVFGSLGEDAVEPPDDFHSRVENEIDAVSLPAVESPGMLRMAVSTLVQTANVLLGSLCISPRPKPTDTTPATPTRPDKATET